jgi:hypothetical protein
MNNLTRRPEVLSLPLQLVFPEHIVAAYEHTPGEIGRRERGKRMRR